MIDIVFLGIDHSHRADFWYKIDPHDWWLMLLTKTKAKFHTPDGEVVAPAGSIVIYPPNTSVWYEAVEDSYVNTYVRFNTDEDFIVNGKYPIAPPIPISKPDIADMLLRVVSAESHLKGANYNRTIRHAMRALFCKIEESVYTEAIPEFRVRLMDLRYDISVRPNYKWTLEEMAKRLHVSVGHLLVSYKKEFGVTCIEDVVNKRIEMAKDLLLNTHYRADMIAEQCGYQSLEHFSRQFKKTVGVSPSEFRRQSLR